MALRQNGVAVHGTVQVNGRRLDTSAGGLMSLVLEADGIEHEWKVAWGSHHEAAYVAAMVGLVMMDAKGYTDVEVETRNPVVVAHMAPGVVGPDHLLGKWASLCKMCELFHAVKFTRI